MGEPVLEPQALPYQAPPEPDQTNTVVLETPNKSRSFGLISMGNPHAVTVVDSVDATAVAEIGQTIQDAVQFPGFGECWIHGNPVHDRNSSTCLRTRRW